MAARRLFSRRFACCGMEIFPFPDEADVENEDSCECPEEKATIVLLVLDE